MAQPGDEAAPAGPKKSGLFLGLTRRQTRSYDARPSRGRLATLVKTTRERRSKPMNVSSESLDAVAIEGGVIRDGYAAVYSQLQHAVQRLVQVALENARHGSETGPLVLRPAGG